MTDPSSGPIPATMAQALLGAVGGASSPHMDNSLGGPWGAGLSSYLVRRLTVCLTMPSNGLTFKGRSAPETGGQTVGAKDP